MDNNRLAYYLSITPEQLLGGKELLKSMPIFYNSVYFCRKYANTLWNEESNDSFKNITLMCNQSDLNKLRQIIKNNFLYVRGWDSLNYIIDQDDDYGFSFIAGNLKYIVIGYKETETGYIIKSYDADSGDCNLTELKDVNKKFFLDTSVNSNNEVVRTCDFDLEDINKENTKTHKADKKVKQEMAIYSSEGFTLASVENLLSIMILLTVVAWTTYMLMKLLP